jgi:methionine S-methyltransferase
LEDCLRANGGDAWVFLNAPISNPTGSIYDEEEVIHILETARKYRAKVVLDTVFSGLEHAGAYMPYALEPFFADKSFALVAIGGVSKEFAAAGLRFGFAYSRNFFIQNALEKGGIAEPHFTVKFACKKMYQAMQDTDGALKKQLQEQQECLSERAQRLLGVLNETGWEALAPAGGLFMIASPVKYFGKTLRLTTPYGEKSWVLDDENISEALFYATGLLVNNARWTGIKKYCRFVLSVSERAFEEALTALRRFDNMF